MIPEEIEIIEIGLINNCVLECPMCTRRDESLLNKTPKSELPLEGLIQFLDKLPSLKIVELVGTISEPVMYSKLISLLKYLKSRSLRVIISTNANVQNGRKLWKEIGEVLDQKDSVKFAVDGSTQEIYEMYRRKGKLSNVLTNHRLFKENTTAVSILQFILFDHNDKDTDNIKELFYKESFDLLEFLPCGEPAKGCGVLPEKGILASYDLKNKIVNNIVDPTITCFALQDRSTYLGHTGVLSPCCDRDEETFGSDMPTIYNSSLEECFDNLNCMFQARNTTRACQINCSAFSLALYDKHEICQMNRKGDSSYIKYWRDYIDV